MEPQQNRPVPSCMSDLLKGIVDAGVVNDAELGEPRLVLLIGAAGSQVLQNPYLQYIDGKIMKEQFQQYLHEFADGL